MTWGTKTSNFLSPKTCRTLESFIDAWRCWRWYPVGSQKDRFEAFQNNTTNHHPAICVIIKLLTQRSSCPKGVKQSNTKKEGIWLNSLLTLSITLDCTPLIREYLKPWQKLQHKILKISKRKHEQTPAYISYSSNHNYLLFRRLQVWKLL